MNEMTNEHTRLRPDVQAIRLEKAKQDRREDTNEVRPPHTKGALFYTYSYIDIYIYMDVLFIYVFIHVYVWPSAKGSARAPLHD